VTRGHYGAPRATTTNNGCYKKFHQVSDGSPGSLFCLAFSNEITSSGSLSERFGGELIVGAGAGSDTFGGCCAGGAFGAGFG
jgi:hypothetical protein